MAASLNRHSRWPEPGISLEQGHGGAPAAGHHAGVPASRRATRIPPRKPASWSAVPAAPEAQQPGSAVPWTRRCSCRPSARGWGRGDSAAPPAPLQQQLPQVLAVGPQQQAVAGGRHMAAEPGADLSTPSTRCPGAPGQGGAAVAGAAEGVQQQRPRACAAAGPAEGAALCAPPGAGGAGGAAHQLRQPRVDPGLVALTARAWAGGPGPRPARRGRIDVVGRRRHHTPPRPGAIPGPGSRGSLCAGT